MLRFRIRVSVLGPPVDVATAVGEEEAVSARRGVAGRGVAGRGSAGVERRMGMDAVAARTEMCPSKLTVSSLTSVTLIDASTFQVGKKPNSCGEIRMPVSFGWKSSRSWTSGLTENHETITRRSLDNDLLAVSELHPV